MNINDKIKSFVAEFSPNSKQISNSDQNNIPTLKQRAKNIISSYNIPAKYLEGFEGDELLLRQIEIIERRKSKDYKELETDKLQRERWRKGEKKKQSSCTKRWNEMYPGKSSLEEKSEITGIPKSILSEVVRKGQGAFYSSGSRPGQTSTSWGNARMNCFILNKPTVTQGPDNKLYKEALEHPKAKEWFDKTEW